MDSKELRLFREAYDSIYTPQTEEIQEETVAEEQRHLLLRLVQLKIY